MQKLFSKVTDGLIYDVLLRKAFGYLHRSSIAFHTSIPSSKSPLSSTRIFELTNQNNVGEPYFAASITMFQRRHASSNADNLNRETSYRLPLICRTSALDPLARITDFIDERATQVDRLI